MPLSAPPDGARGQRWGCLAEARPPLLCGTTSQPPNLCLSPLPLRRVRRQAQGGEGGQRYCTEGPGAEGTRPE